MAFVSLSAEYAEAYKKSFQAFVNNSTEKQNLVRWIRENAPPMISEMRSVERDTINILSVGCGTGEKDIQLLSSSVQHFRQNQTAKLPKPKICYRVVEPNSEHIAAFKASTIADGLKALPYVEDTTFKWYQETFQSYVEREHEKNTLDVILFIHSIYYVDVEKALVECYENELNKTGFIMCVVEAEESDLKQFVTSQRVSKFHENVTSYTDQDVVKVANKHKWPYRQFSVDNSIDVSECFDEKSEEGNLLLDFFFHVKDCRGTVPKEELTEALRDLKKLCSSENEYGKVFLKAIFGVIVIHTSY